MQYPKYLKLPKGESIVLITDAPYHFVESLKDSEKKKQLNKLLEVMEDDVNDSLLFISLLNKEDRDMYQNFLYDKYIEIQNVSNEYLKSYMKLVNMKKDEIVMSDEFNARAEDIVDLRALGMIFDLLSEYMNCIIFCNFKESYDKDKKEIDDLLNASINSLSDAISNVDSSEIISRLSNLFKKQINGTDECSADE